MEATRDNRTLIDAEAFRQWLAREKSIRSLFRWKISPEDAYMMLTSAYAREVQIRGGHPRNEKQVLDNLKSIAEFMTGDTSWKTGILLCGNCGNGKTTAMAAFFTVSEYLRRLEGPAASGRFAEVVSARKVAQMAKEENGLAQYKGVAVLGLDDMGLEATDVLDYGNILNPVIEVIEERYRRQNFTFVTTNITPPEVRRKYGDRVADRFNEMMKVIVFDNSSFRK